MSYLDATIGTRLDPYQQEMMESFWKQAVTGQDQLRQRVAFALSQILVVSFNSNLNSEPFALAGYLDLLSKDAFGNFRQLLEDVTLSPTMGRYLDMLQNDKEDVATGKNPNENYAREVLQLFSIGLYKLHPDGSLVLDANGLPIATYDQEVVKGFAHVFTGWSYGWFAKTEQNWLYPNAYHNGTQFWRVPRRPAAMTSRLCCRAISARTRPSICSSTCFVPSGVPSPMLRVTARLCAAWPSSTRRRARNTCTPSSSSSSACSSRPGFAP